MKIIEQYDHSTANVLVPTQTITQVSPWHAARTSVVQVNPDPAAGDVFKVGSRYNAQTKQSEDLYCLAKPALMRIAAAAGIVWNWRESGPQALQRDYVVYRAVGAVRLPDGSWQPIVGTKEIDLTVVEEELREANLAKAQELASDPKKREYLRGMTPEQWAEVQTRTAMIQWRKNKLMRAETGAMERVIKAALGIKSQYTREELQKPFIVPRIDFSPDYSDPEVRRALIEHGVNAMAGLFGQTLPSSAAAALPSGRQPAPFERPPIESAAFTDQEGADEIPEPDLGPDDEIPPWDDEPQEAPPSPAAAPTAAAGNTQRPSSAQQAGTVCAACGKAVTEKVADYSWKHFGQVLCYGCQRKEGQAGGGAA